MAANFATTSAGYDTTFELNNFSEPRIRSELETIKNAVLFIFFSKPGNYPSIPQIGMDIESILYSYYDELDPDEIKETLKGQCALLGTYISDNTIQIQKVRYKGVPSLVVHISGTESYPRGYKNDSSNKDKSYLIGLTYNDMKELIYNVNVKED